MGRTGQDGLTASAIAHSNIALAKYWGKRDSRLNIPAVGSISITLDALSTETAVSFSPDLQADELVLNGGSAPAQKASRVLDLIRERAGIDLAAQVVSNNNFPTGAGLASSASGLAALAVAAAAAAGLELNSKELSIIARRGSASAARSIFGGFAELHSGNAADGSDSFAEQLMPAEDWPLSVVVAITQTEPKATSSTEGMLSTSGSSPFYNTWVEGAPTALDELRAAVLARDLEKTGALTERSCLAMHSLMFTTSPPLIYWNPATVAVIRRVTELRRDGIEGYFTIDAGPQVKIICEPDRAEQISASVAELPGVLQTITTRLGPAARLVQSP